MELSQNLQISDFIGEYPELSDRLFNTKISRKVEFSELGSDLSEPVPERGKGYKHQRFSVRYLEHYNRELLLHDPGTGKSCIIVHSAEVFKKHYLANPDDPTRIKKAIIITGGPSLKNNILNEIVCKCTKIYETDAVLNSKDQKTMKQNIKHEIKGWYQIMTYNDFAKKVKEFITDEALDEWMSNKIFYIDEAHNVPKIEDIKRKFKRPTTVAEANALRERDRQKYEERLQKYAQQGGRKPKENKFGETNYDTFYRAMHRGHRNIFVAVTATPMDNSPVDLIPLMNLLLPLDQQMPDWTEEQMLNLKLEDIEPYFRGRVSYVRSQVTGVVPVYQGEPIYQPADEPYPPDVIYIDGVAAIESKTKVYRVGMSDFQYSAYLSLPDIRAEKTTTVLDKNTSTRKNTFYIEHRQASDFVFPDGSFGTEGYRRYIDDKKVDFKQDENGHLLRELMSRRDIYEDGSLSLPMMSAKYNEIVRICEEMYPNSEAEYDLKHGIVFIYFDDFVTGSGANILSLCLRANGYYQFTDSGSVFTSGYSVGLGPCASSAKIDKERQVRIPKHKRYALLTSDTTPAQITALFDIARSYENRYGEYVQVIIASKTAREGINISNGMAMFIVTSAFTYSANIQARDRVFRSTSHEMRLKELRKPIQDTIDQIDEQLKEKEEDVELLARRAELTEELKKITIPVPVYIMASVYYDYSTETGENTNEDTADIKMVLITEVKDKRISKMKRFIKESAVDCYINRFRNIRETDEDGSANCDYQSCNYGCSGIDQELVNIPDWTTKLLYYSDDEVEEATKQIIGLFARFHNLTTDQIKWHLSGINPVFIDMALEKMINENVKLIDRFGHNSYLREGAGRLIYLEKDQFEIRSQPENTIYSSNIIGVQDPKTDLFDYYVTNITGLSEISLVEELKNIDPRTNGELFAEKLDALSLMSKVNLLEFVIKTKVETEQTSDFYEAIIEAFQHNVFKMDEPREKLKDVAISIANKGKGQGRKPEATKSSNAYIIKGTFQIPQFNMEEPAEPIYVHTLLNQSTTSRTNYGSVAKLKNANGQIRLYKKSENIGWRNVNEYEYGVYNTIVRENIDKIYKYFDRKVIYGIMLPPGNNFLIKDVEREESNTRGKEDERNKTPGRACISWGKPDLTDMLYRLGIPAPNINVTNLTREHIYQFFRGQKDDTIPIEVLGQFDDYKIVYYYLWYQYTKKNMCETLFNNFVVTGRLFTGKVSAELMSEISQLDANAIVGTIRAPPEIETTPETIPAE